MEVVLRPVGVISVAAIRRTAAGLGVSHSPRLRPNGTKYRMRTHRASPFFRVVGLQQQTALVGPEAVQRADDVLKVHMSVFSSGGGVFGRKALLFGR